MKQTLIAAALLLWAGASRAALVTTQVNTAIPDNDLAGVASQISLSGLSGSYSSISVSLNISGTCNGDLYAYLSHGDDLVVLLNRPGVTATDSVGYTDQGLNVTFQDGAPNIHFYQQTLGSPGTLAPLTGVWGPDGRAVSPLLVNGTETPTATLSSLLGPDLNGAWTLFVADASGGDLQTFNSWTLDIVAVPEPAWFGLAGAAAGVLIMGWQRLRGSLSRRAR